jgi:hypothetical protein
MKSFKSRATAVVAAVLLGSTGGLFVNMPVHAAASSPGDGYGKEITPPPASGKGKVAKKGTKPVVSINGQKKTQPPRSGGPAKRALTPCLPDCHMYTAVGQSFSADPITSARYDFSIEKPYHADGMGSYQNNYATGQDGSFSLVEMGVTDDSSVPGGYNTVEVGSIVAPHLNAGSTNPHMFVFHWLKNVPQGYNLTGGFVDYSGGVGFSPVGPGDSLVADIGSVKRFQIQWLDNVVSTGRQGWWIAYNNLWVGYYPQALWSSAGETFEEAATAHGYGEIASTNEESCSDMGSGVMAAAGVGASISNFAVLGTSITADIDSFTIIDRPTRWNLTGTGPVYYGGPGYDSLGVGLGVTGSCAPPAEGVSVTSGLQGWEEVCPDFQLVTGCNDSWSKAWSTATIGVCTPVPVPGTTVTNAIWNRSLSSGKTFQIFRGISCSGTAKTYGNAAKEAFPAGSGWEGTNIRAYKRTA